MMLFLIALLFDAVGAYRIEGVSGVGGLCLSSPTFGNMTLFDALGQRITCTRSRGGVCELPTLSKSGTFEWSPYLPWLCSKPEVYAITNCSSGS